MITYSQYTKEAQDKFMNIRHKTEIISKQLQITG